MKDYIDIIDSEIEWCKNNKEKSGHTCPDSFIKGLEQAKRLINAFNNVTSTIEQQSLSGSADASPKLKLNKPTKLEYQAIEDENGFI
jgi:hypothetical protein